MKRRKVSIEIIALIILSSVLYAFQFSTGLTPSEERGKLIYTTGVRASGEPIKAQLSGAQFDAKILPCSNCHGSRGEGNPEGGVDPSPLDWSSLTKPYSIEFKNGRKRAGYSHASLKRAIVDGIDPSKNKLDLVMPRYDLNDEDVSDLISYLKIIDKEDLAGITDSLIHVGIILSSKNGSRLRAESITKTIEAYLDLVNKGGGVYNRKFHLSQILIEDSSQKTDSLINDILQKKDIFAFIASDLEDIPLLTLTTLENTKIPVIGAITGNPEKGEYIRNNFYYLFSGVDQEVQALARFAKDSLAANQDDFVVLFDSSSFNQNIDLDRIIKETGIRLEYIIPNEVDALTQLEKLKNEGIQNCLLIGDAQYCSNQLSYALKVNWYPNILLSGKYASASWLDNPLEMNNKIFLSYPVWIADRNDIAMKQYEFMASHYDLDNNYKNAQLNALAATILFTETMKLTGKVVSRESMLETLHGLQPFESGFVAPLSYGPNKRIGSEKVSIVKADLVNKKLLLVN